MPHFAPGKMHMVPLFILFGVVLLGNAQNIPCNVTKGADWTRYSVPEFNATSCHYSWANATSHVVANHEEELEYLVLTKTRFILIINKCLEQVLYKRDCISEGISCHATCTTTCSENAGVLHNERGIRHHSCIAISAAFILLLFGLFFAIRCGKCQCINATAA